jgi:signal transduction histidine kinase
LLQDRQGTMWVASADKKLTLVGNEKLAVYDQRDGLPQDLCRPLLEDRDGNIWFATTNKGLVEFKAGRFTTLTRAQGLSSNAITTVYQDREGTLWIGTLDGGLNRLTRQMITVYSDGEGLSSTNVYPICQDKAGAIWVGTWGGGLFRYSDGRFHKFQSQGQLPGDKITSLMEDREGRLWIGRIGGVSWLKDGTIHDLPLSDKTGFVTNVRAICEDRLGSLWFGTDSAGLACYKDGALTLYTKEQGLAGNDVKAIIEDRQGSLWIATYGGLSQYNNGAFRSMTEADGLASDKVRSLYEDNDGAIWIGTYDGGLSRLKDSKLTSYTTRDGLFSNGAFQILEDDRQNFWMSCNLGIYRVARQQLDDFAAGRIKAVNCVPFGRSDGLLDLECNGGVQPSGIKTRDGRLWFPTQEGVAVIDPEQMPINVEPPPVVIENCILNREPIDFRDGIDVRPGSENLEIGYGGLSFIKPEQVRFKYMLEGLDSDWKDVGPRRIAYYPYLPPGTYTFRVIASNSDGIWNTEGASLLITVHPPFWRTWWFTILSAMIAAAIAIVVYERRVWLLKRARQSQEAFSRRLIESQEADRRRIAAELHDSLGQSLIVIKNWALLGLSVAARNAPPREHLDEISETATRAIHEVREIAYNLGPFQLERLGLQSTIEEMVNKLASASAIRISATIDPIDGLFTRDAEISVYRIVQEAINNVVKHSKATEASISIRRNGQHLEIEIRDNGRGFSREAAAAENAARRGFGLVGIEERARILGGSSAVKSEPARGACVSISIPLPPSEVDSAQRAEDVQELANTTERQTQ